MPSIITITISPCIDISARVPELIPHKKLRCNQLKKEAGGGGINVSRVITRFGGDTTAVYLAGGYTGEYFSIMMNDEKVDSLVIPTENHTRENFVIAEDLTNLQYRFGMPGPEIHEKEWKQCLDAIDSFKDIDYIVASGSLSSGVPTDFFARIAVMANRKNIKLILDTSDEALQLALEQGVYMIKPNLGELASLSGIKVLTKESAISAAREIINKNFCSLVLISMGPEGAILVTPDITEHVLPPEVKIKSTVGAGDSMVAGFVLSLSMNKSLKECLKFAVACGTAATMNEGTALCNKDDVFMLLELMNRN